MERFKKGISRRQLLRGAAATGGSLALAGIASGTLAEAQEASTMPTRLRALTREEAEIVGAMADRAFPRDGSSPSATEIGFIHYLDEQLAGGWGSGERFYRQGPFVQPQTSGHGYQLSLIPREVYKRVLPVVDSYARSRYGGRSFTEITPSQQDTVMTALQNGRVDIGLGNDPNGFTSGSFFTMFMANVNEGLFADPIYGGNRDTQGWRWVGYPGDPMAYGDYYFTVFQHRDDDYQVQPTGVGHGME
ncbi:MAG TPA: gluconate 2-dehydrogenase subunit 3 family protein [Conexibacter sp.]|jgi:gluconate 2-dehydrogenase gamma chain